MQFNVEIPEKCAERVRIDAIKMGVSLGTWSEQAFDRFLAMPIAQRRVYFPEKRAGKIIGRPISLAAAVTAGLLLMNFYQAYLNYTALKNVADITAAHDQHHTKLAGK